MGQFIEINGQPISLDWIARSTWTYRRPGYMNIWVRFPGSCRSSNVIVSGTTADYLFNLIGKD